MKKRRVVITGLGIVCPVGNTIAEAWRNILNGNSGIATLENIDTEGQAVTFGGSVKNFDVSDYLSPKEAKKNGHLYTLWYGSRNSSYRR